MSALTVILPTAYFSALGFGAFMVMNEWFSTLKMIMKTNQSLNMIFLIFSIPFSLISFYITWTLIFDFFGVYLIQYNCNETRFSLFTCNSNEWLNAPTGDTFIEAYVQVTNTLGGWIWSSSLLSFVVPGCLWLHIEGTRVGLSKLKQLSFLLLAFLGAVSASFPIAFAVIYSKQTLLLNTDKKGKKDDAARKLVPMISFKLLGLPCILALLSSMLLPLSVHLENRWTYVIALSLLHFILMVPTLFNQSKKEQKEEQKESGRISDALKLASIYAFVAGAIFIQHSHNISNYLIYEFNQPIITTSLLSFLKQFISSGWSNYCQSSISYDTVFSGIACIMFMISTRRLFSSHFILNSFYILFFSLLCSPACVFATYLSLEALSTHSFKSNKRMN